MSKQSTPFLPPLDPFATQSASIPACGHEESKVELTSALRQSIDITGLPLTVFPPGAAASLESVLRTEILDRRPARLPDYETENRALTALAGALSDSPQTILQTLADTILEVFQCGSAGMSLLTDDGNRFYWPAIAGVWKAHVGGGTPREFGPCGDVLDHNIPLLFTHFERRYPYLQAASPAGEECLLVPFYVAGKSVGTIWAIAHDHSRQFDSEDRRLLVSLGRFASAAYQMSSALTSSKADLVVQMRSEQVLLRKSEKFLAGQRDAFELAMRGAPIITVLERIVRIARDIFGDDDAVRAAIFTVDADGKHLRFGVAAELAEAYTSAVDGMEIGPNHPSSGTVAYTGETVIVRDIEADPLWTPYLPLARAHGIAACWSFPIRAVGGKVMGTLAIYHCAPCVPEPPHLASIGLLAETAAVILERHKLTEEHLRAVEQLGHSHEAFYSLIQNARFGLYVVDAQFRMRHVSAAAQKVFSKIDPLIGRDFEEILRMVWAEPFATEVIGHFRRTLKTGEPYASPNTTEPRGNVAVVESYDWNIERVILPDGQFGIVCYFYDVTERKRSEQALHESKRFLSSSLDAMTSQITVLDEKGVILAVNESWRTFADRNDYVGEENGVGTNYLEACGKACANGLAGAAGPLFAAAIQEVIAGRREMFEAEYPCHSPTERRWFLMQVTRFQGAGPTRVVIVHENITARKRAEDSLKEARHAAETANDAKDKFLAVLSHELRTPLTPVMMTVAAMESDPELPQAFLADLQMVRRNVELEVKLIDDLLDISRITSGKLHLKLIRVDLNELVRHACEMCHPTVREKGIRLHRDLDEKAGAILGDPSRLQQVFWNLLNNAVKFTPEGGDIYITTGNVAADGVGRGGHAESVRVTVRDTGRGIAPEALPRIFDAFEQGDVKVTRQFGGLGLGLAISKRLVEQHHGSIRAETDGPDRGSTFIVELPAAPREEAARVPERPLPGPDAKNIPLRVLVVEDHADTARILARLMTASGYTVKTATTGTQALELAGENVFDLIVSDLGLPDITGYDVMRQIREKYGTKGIAMSGNGLEEDIQRSRLAGFSEHLLKPVDFSQLEQAMRRVAAERPPGQSGPTVE